MIYDLHSHSNASDGSLDPDDLLLHAAQSGVDTLAITDHDTLAAFDRTQLDITDRTRVDAPDPDPAAVTLVDHH